MMWALTQRCNPLKQLLALSDLLLVSDDTEVLLIKHRSNLRSQRADLLTGRIQYLIPLLLHLFLCDLAKICIQ